MTVLRTCKACGKELALTASNFRYTAKQDSYLYTCRTCLNVYFREYRQKNAEYIKERDRNDKERLHRNGKKYYMRHKAMRDASNAKRSISARELARQQVFDHYGRICKCCGETEQVFLTLDHIHGGGTQARKQFKGERFYQEIVRNGFVAELQTLCWNCNWAKHRLGICPHQTKKY